ncbi:transcription elongation factor TFIIS [Coemansia sp. RSA 2322]|uniref:Transcription elongation factor n=1 Tax=Coemansia thaxteri TaxID=2663907 RepID=A0A9W8EHM8_9FUNG|nr:transcription elongation factor TFIIS [Coemansia thaxteri]KAJ2471508.1 transcription elongation factor TFIIS [Coemansia sp. RSA 2322]
MSAEINKHDEIKTLCKALSAALDADKKTELDTLLNKLYAIRVDEKLLRATGAGQIVGKLRNHEEAKIAVLANKVVRRWKKDVLAANPRQNGTPAAAKSSSGSQTPVSTTHSATPQQPPQQLQSKELRSDKTLTPSASSDGRPADWSSLGGNSADGLSSAAAAGRPASSTTTKAASGTGSDAARTTGAASSAAAPSSLPPAPRTAAADEASIPATGDSVRDKCAELLYNSLAVDSNADSELLARRASGIEILEFGKAASTSTAYRARIRSLCLNLRNQKNPDLRNNLVEGSLTIERFCSMTSEEMASKELRETIEKMKEENLFKAKGAGQSAAVTDQFRCGRCRGRKCTYYQMQTRSADEPMTTFVTCTICDNNWKFC